MPTLLILGATSDIGLAVADRYAMEGWDIQLAGRNPDALEPKVNDLTLRFSVKVSAHQFDAMDTASHEAFVEGLTPIPDLTVCMFGLLGDENEAKKSSQAFGCVATTNYTGAVTILNALAARYRDQKSGGIIGVSSVAGDRGRKSNYHYGSAKAGFTAYLSGLRGDLAESNVHVMTVKPGFVRTRMTENMDLPGLLTADPDEVANDIYTSWSKKKNTIYTKWFWRWIMLIINCVPETIFKKLNF